MSGKAERTVGPGPSPAAAVAALASALDVLAGVDPRDLDGAALHALLRQIDVANRRLAGLRSRILPVVEEDGRWAAQGARSFPAWLRQTTSGSSHETRRQARTARALRDHLPSTAAALASGTITAEHADLLASHATKTPERIAALMHPEVGEAFLVAQAERFDASDFARLVRSWAIAADPAGSDTDYAEQADRQQLVLAKVLHGYHVQGWLDDAGGAVLEAALNATIGTPSSSDGRTTAQRRAAALVTLARTFLDSGAVQPGAAVRPHLTVHVPHETLTRLVEAQAPPGPSSGSYPGAQDAPQEADSVTIPGELGHGPLTGALPAELDDGTPVPPALLARLACDSELARVIFGPTGEVLDVGRTRRLFTPGQRRGVIARDRTCRFPGCDSPPAHGEIHHSIWWYAQHGGTSTDNGVLLCWYHHDYVHRQGITIARRTDGGGTGTGRESDAGAGPTNTWTFTRPNGAEISAGPARGSPRAA